MTENKPSTDTQQQLCFGYDILAKQILFTNLSLNDFFSSSLSPEDDPPFLKAFDDTHLTSQWQSCLQLKENELKSFTAATKEKPQLLFSFNVMRPPSLLLKDKSILIVTVSKPATSVSDNKDYSEFIELASHDLDSPVRKLALLSERLFDKLKDSIDADTKKYLERMQKSLSEIRSMVDDLSALARLNPASLEVSKCDIKNIINETLNQLHHGEVTPVVSMNELPVIEGDTMQYKKLFSNLLQNAIKFKRKDTIPEIKIHSEILQDSLKKHYLLPVNKNYYKVVVEDNGIGFNQENAEKIFIPFVRLNGKSEYPGNGIGLALCKKIVENHGGIIYAHGKEKTGTSFTLILPQSPQH
jgi:signal transduction histidine kinase